MSQNQIEISFPELVAGGYTVSSPETPEYNCIAWAVGSTDTWWWPDQFGQYYWPPDVPRNESLEAFVKAFEAIGFSVSDNAEYEEGYEKVAIYADVYGRPKHAARQVSPGIWTSKLGSLEDIEHPYEGVSGSIYGSITVVMKRRK